MILSGLIDVEENLIGQIAKYLNVLYQLNDLILSGLVYAEEKLIRQIVKYLNVIYQLNGPPTLTILTSLTGDSGKLSFELYSAQSLKDPRE